MKALRTFGEDYPEAERFLLYRGREKLHAMALSDDELP
jgi:hypothetical protein